MMLSRLPVDRLLGTLTHVVTRESVGALTFDDGPDPVWTPQVLDTLDRHDAKATFFMIGERAASYPGLVREVAARGHALANHSWDHQPFTRITSPQRWRQVMDTERQLVDQALKLFRPPKGCMSVGSRCDLLFMRYKPVTWNIAVNDWQTRCVETMTAQLAAEIRPGCIVLLHDSIWETGSRFYDRRPLIKALDAALSSLDHFRFLTLPALLQKGKPFLAPWFFDEAE